MQSKIEKPWPWWLKIYDTLFPWNKGVCRHCGKKFQLKDEKWYHDGYSAYRIWHCDCGILATEE